MPNWLFLVAIFAIAYFTFGTIATACKIRWGWAVPIVFAGACTVVAAKYLLTF